MKHNKVSESTLGAAPGIVRDAAHWQDLMARAEAVRAANDKLPENVRKYRICKDDTVSIRRKLLVNDNLIPSGSLGILVLERNNGRLYDVSFFCAPGSYITLSAFDLQIAL
jgi:hypothetical protein